jgi:hypothetical protein
LGFVERLSNKAVTNSSAGKKWRTREVLLTAWHFFVFAENVAMQVWTNRH